MINPFVPSLFENILYTSETKFPLFSQQEKVNTLVEDCLLDKPSLFLIDLTITDAFKIIVNIDGDNGVALQDCIDVSRSIENNLDRIKAESKESIKKPLYYNQ